MLREAVQNDQLPMVPSATTAQQWPQKTKNGVNYTNRIVNDRRPQRELQAFSIVTDLFQIKNTIEKETATRNVLLAAV